MGRKDPIINSIPFLKDKLYELRDKLRERREHYPCNNPASSYSSISKGKQLGLIFTIREIIDELNKQQDILPDYLLEVKDTPRYTSTIIR